MKMESSRTETIGWGLDQKRGGEHSQEILESKPPYFGTPLKNNRKGSYVKSEAFLIPA